MKQNYIKVKNDHIVQLFLNTSILESYLVGLEEKTVAGYLYFPKKFQVISNVTSSF